MNMCEEDVLENIDELMNLCCQDTQGDQSLQDICGGGGGGSAACDGLFPGQDNQLLLPLPDEDTPVSVLKSIRSCSEVQTIPINHEIVLRGKAHIKSPHTEVFIHQPMIRLTSLTTSSTDLPITLQIPKPSAPELKMRMKEKKSATPASTEQFVSQKTGLVRKCLYCDITNTPQWRTGPLGMILCNACGLKYNKGQIFPEYQSAASPTYIMPSQSNSEPMAPLIPPSSSTDPNQPATLHTPKTIETDMKKRTKKKLPVTLGSIGQSASQQTKPVWKCSHLNLTKLIATDLKKRKKLPVTRGSIEQSASKQIRKCLHCDTTEIPKRSTGPLGKTVSAASSTMITPLVPVIPLVSPTSSILPYPSELSSKLEILAESRTTLEIPKPVAAESNKNKKVNVSHLPDSVEESIMPDKKCSHCGITKTPLWRMGPMGPKTLCNACGVRYKSGRLFPEYRPAASPTFVPTLYSNFHKKVLEMRDFQKEYISKEGSKFLFRNNSIVRIPQPLDNSHSRVEFQAGYSEHSRCFAFVMITYTGNNIISKVNFEIWDMEEKEENNYLTLKATIQAIEWCKEAGSSEIQLESKSEIAARYLLEDEGHPIEMIDMIHKLKRKLIKLESFSFRFCKHSTLSPGDLALEAVLGKEPSNIINDIEMYFPFLIN